MNTLEPIDPAPWQAAAGQAAGIDRAENRSLRWIVAITAGAALGIWLVVASILHLHSDQYRDELAASLLDLNGSVAEFLAAWAGDLESTLEFVVSQPAVVSAVGEVIEARGLDANDLAALEATLGPLGETETSVVLADPDGTIVAHSGGEEITSDAALMAAVAGDPRPAFTVLPPRAGDVTDAGPIPGGVRVWAAVGGAGSPVGWLGVEVDVGPITRMLRSGTTTSESREIYVFDNAGRLVTPSRFEHQLVEMGLVDPGGTSIGLPLLDPGHDLLRSYGAGPSPDADLTLMATSALGGETGVNVEGYRDYRGVEVVGAWTWVDELGVGLATEMDRSEAFASFSRTSRTWAIGAAVLTVLIVVLSLVFGITDHRLRRARRELINLTDHLDEEVRARTADLEAARQRAEAEATARAELVAAVSHELRTPLTSVIGFARLLKEREAELDPSLRVLLEPLLQEGEEMADLVDDLLTSVRLSTASLELSTDVLDLGGQARATVSAWGPAEGGRIDVDGTSVMAVGDPLRVRQIIRNLVSNAVRHGGPAVRVIAESSGEEATVSVEDDGPPIDPSVQVRMFDSHERGVSKDGLAPSLGIGLSLCRHLAMAMGGTIEFGRVDEWNRFTLHLPVPNRLPIDTAA